MAMPLCKIEGETAARRGKAKEGGSSGQIAIFERERKKRKQQWSRASHSYILTRANGTLDGEGSGEGERKNGKN